MHAAGLFLPGRLQVEVLLDNRPLRVVGAGPLGVRRVGPPAGRNGQDQQDDGHPNAFDGTPIPWDRSTHVPSCFSSAAPASGRTLPAPGNPSDIMERRQRRTIAGRAIARYDRAARA